MKHITLIFFLALTFPILFNAKKVHAQPSPTPIKLTHQQYTKLNAVLVIGSSTTIDTSVINLGKYLKSLGVNVYEFYHPNAMWDSIVSIDKPIHIFVYSGHGTLRGQNNTPGGLVISEPKYISSSAIRNDLPLAKNALILFQSVCLSAGSSADDDSNITLNNAIFRVENYAKPFIEKEVGAYYAVNFSNALKPFLEDFFKGVPAIEIFRKAFAIWCDTQTTKQYSFNKSYQVSITSSMQKNPTTRTSNINGEIETKKVGPFLGYQKAFVGKPDFSVLDFFK